MLVGNLIKKIYVPGSDVGARARREFALWDGEPCSGSIVSREFEKCSVHTWGMQCRFSHPFILIRRYLINVKFIKSGALREGIVTIIIVLGDTVLVCTITVWWRRGSGKIL